MKKSELCSLKKLTQLTGAPNKCNSIKKWTFKREVEGVRYSEVVGDPASIPSMAGGEEKGMEIGWATVWGRGSQGGGIGDEGA